MILSEYIRTKPAKDRLYQVTADIFTLCVFRKKSFISFPDVIKVVHADKFSEGGVFCAYLEQ